MANDLATTQPRAYGGLKPSATIGADEFAAHDHGKAWDDGGASQGIAEDVKAYGAEQAKQAVMDYLSNAFADISVVNGKLCFMIDSSNNEANFAVLWKLEDVIQKAMVEAENAGDAAMLEAIGGFLGQLSHTFRPPVTAAAGRPGRTVREGGARPGAGAGAGAVRSGGARRGRTQPSEADRS